MQGLLALGQLTQCKHSVLSACDLPVARLSSVPLIRLLKYRPRCQRGTWPQDVFEPWKPEERSPEVSLQHSILCQATTMAAARKHKPG